MQTEPLWPARPAIPMYTIAGVLLAIVGAADAIGRHDSPMWVLAAIGVCLAVTGFIKRR
jgi:hypothetical protein